MPSAHLWMIVVPYSVHRSLYPVYNGQNTVKKGWMLNNMEYIFKIHILVLELKESKKSEIDVRK